MPLPTPGEQPNNQSPAGEPDLRLGDLNSQNARVGSSFPISNGDHFLVDSHYDCFYCGGDHPDSRCPRWNP